MAYGKKTIIKTINDILTRKMYLPAIQRKFVWNNEEKITRLMDSIMCKYPFGTFLYWDVSQDVINNNGYSLYEFICNYSEMDGFVNEKSPGPLTGGENIFAVLDGQQRLTSLYIALQGSLALHRRGGRWNDPTSFPKKELYFNVKSGGTPIDEDEDGNDCKYEFKFLTEEEASPPTQGWNTQVEAVLDQQARATLQAISYDKKNVDKLLEAVELVPNATKRERLRKKVAMLEASAPVWFKVKDAVASSVPDNLTTMIIDRGWGADAVIQKNLQTLVNRLHHDELINYFAVEESTMDNVLDIFVRVNSAGVVLSKADLLFSTIVASWDRAREVIDDLLKRINGNNKEFNFNSDFVVRSCLYLLDKPFKLKVENLSKQYVDEVKSKWTNIENAIVGSVKLLEDMGFNNASKFTSHNAVRPLVYWLYHSGDVSGSDKERVRKFFVCSQIKGIFGRSCDTHLAKIREKLKANSSQFPARAFLKFVYRVSVMYEIGLAFPFSKHPPRFKQELL